MAIMTDVFNPGDIDPVHFVDRKEKEKELYDTLQSWLQDPEKFDGACLITGERGIGKSMLTHQVINRLRGSFSGNVAIVIAKGATETDGFKGLLLNILLELKSELKSLDSSTQNKYEKIPEDIYKQIGFLEELARHKKVTIRRVKETLKKFNYSLSVSQPPQLPSFIAGRLGYSAERSDRDSLEMEEEFDLYTLRESLCQIFDELKKHRQKVVVFIDDLDQVYGISATRIEQTDIMFKHLRETRNCIKIINLRDYYKSGETSREFHEVFTLGPMEKQALRDLAWARCQSEAEPKRTQIWNLLEPCLDILVSKTGNPLAFVIWCNWLVTRTNCKLSDLESNLKRYVSEHYSTVESYINSVINLYRKADEKKLWRKELLDSFPGGEDQLMLLEEKEVILPLDYRRRFQYTFNSVFHFWL